ncbi:hypothetical protein NB700_003770 [Xanthomonas sacchari]|uniref:Uncharacterized protein n=1 Tax=Xanthomonas sacchari TaxID=56458 RepID=A0ABT3E0D1_9XANT|nr:hypothetical protein [Xanthomonas sacchari]
MLRAGLHQRDRPGQTRFAAQRRRHGRATARRLRGDVQAQRRGVAVHRLDVLDDEAVATVRRQLPDVEILTPQRAFGGDEAFLLGRRDTADEAEASGARKLAAQIAALAVAQHLIAVQFVAGGDDHAAHAAQAVVVVGQQLFDAVEGDVGFRVQLRLRVPRVGPLQLQRHRGGERRADQQRRQRPIERTALEQQPGHPQAPPRSAVSVDRALHALSQSQCPALANTTRHPQCVIASSAWWKQT